MSNADHVAGIIPINSQPMDFQMPWHDCLQPIAPNFLSIERAILECASAGCETIWLACPLGIQPLLRQRIGNYVQDPLNFFKKKFSRFPTSAEKLIPIYYIPVHPKDNDKRDSIVWNMLYGCTSVNRVASKISKWLIPQKYFICFPNVVYPSQYILKRRKDILFKRRFLVATPEGETILDGKQVSATINNDDVKFLIKEFKKQATGEWDGTSALRDGKYPTQRLPLDQRYSGRFLTVKDVFSKLPPEENTSIMKTPWYYSLDSWENLCQYMRSEHSKLMKRPVRPLLTERTLMGISSELD